MLMNAVEFSASEEQKALGTRLIPWIGKYTEDYFTPGREHPFLEGLAKGGIVIDSPEDNTAGTEAYTVVSAEGHRETYATERFARIGIPEHVAAGGLMWVVMTSKYHCNRALSGQAIDRIEKVDHCFTYWNGGRWVTARHIPSTHASNQPWETMWQSSALTATETKALEATARQTEQVHEVAQLFSKRDIHWRLPSMLITLAETEGKKELLERGLGRDTSYRPGEPAYMRHFATAFQGLDHLVGAAAALIEGRSFRLDSTGLKDAGYHRGSAPSTSEMLAGGENIVAHRIHPPVPAEMVRYYRAPQPISVRRPITAV